HGYLDSSGYGTARDAVGFAMMATVPDFQLEELALRFVGCDDEETRGGLVGAEIGLYRFRTARAGKMPPVRLVAPEIDADVIAAAGRLGANVNLARHLVNLPPADLDPASFADAAKNLFAGSKTTSVQIWDPD